MLGRSHAGRSPAAVDRANLLYRFSPPPSATPAFVRAVSVVRIPATGVLHGSVVITPRPSGTDTARPADYSQGRHSSLRAGIRS